MNIGSKTQYALRTLVDLAGRKDGEVATVADIAKRRNIPPQYLEQILLLLKRGGLVKSLRGRQGGYILAREGTKVSLADVLALTEDALPEIRSGTDGLERTILKTWRRMNGQFVQSMRQVTIQDLLDEAETLSISNYSI
jgi:Rrf2 family cysteine metabolism transcriptional repressor